MRIAIDNVKCKITGASGAVISLLYKELSVKVPQYFFSSAFKMGRWDGYQRFLVRPANVFPTGLLPKVLDLLKDMDVVVELQDNREGLDEIHMDLASEDFQIGEFKKARDYQIDAINKVITNNIHGLPFNRGIINIATNGGKTVIAEGIIQQLYQSLVDSQKNFLFVTHSKEIARQARKSIMDDLQIPVGMIGDGAWEVEPVTVAIVTTLFRRLKDRKIEWECLKDNVVGFVGDECLPYDSMILLPDFTYKTIKDICENDFIQEVMSYNVKTQQLEPKRILRKIVNAHDGEFYTVFLSSGTMNLSATKNHKVYTTNRGYIKLEELSSMDTLIRMNGTKPQETHLLPSYTKVFPHDTQLMTRYNLEVEDNHNYFANGILVSNCHHSAADSWYTVFNNFPNASIRLGLTGTIDKTKPVQEMKLYACTGSVLTRVSNEYLINRGYSAKPKCILFKVDRPELGEMDYPEAYQLGIVESADRNRMITAICDKETDSNNKVLVLVEHIEHGEILEDAMQKLNKHVYFTNGQLSSDTREELLNRLRNGQLDVLISSNILDEGIDVSGINAVVYARGMKSMRKLLQGIGRGLRLKEDGSPLRFYDFIDDMHLTLLNHSMDRYKTLKSEKFDTCLLTITEYTQMSWDEINAKCGVKKK